MEFYKCNNVNGAGSSFAIIVFTLKFKTQDFIKNTAFIQIKYLLVLYKQILLQNFLYIMYTYMIILTFKLFKFIQVIFR